MKQVWTLDPFFKGGSESVEFQQFLDGLEKGYAQIPRLDLKEALLASQELQKGVTEAVSYVECLNAQNVKDVKAKELQARCNALSAEGDKAKNLLDEKLVKLSEEEFEGLFGSSDIRFVLEERRDLAKKRLSADKEALIVDLSVDGYHGWSNYRDTLVGSMVFPVGGKNLSQGQIENLFAKKERPLRQEAAKSYVAAYKEKEEHFAALLNHISGFRLKMYGARGWDLLEEPCNYNRISPKTLSAMWGAVAKNRARFMPFLQTKARLLGLKKLSWYDLDAPLGPEKEDIPFVEGGNFIVQQFQAVSPKMAQFAKKALASGWVEAEDRPGKQPGGFCTNFPRTKEMRVFMTYSNTLNNVVVLAHELGHGFHADCLFSLPYFNQQYAMNVAETASTMAEMIVADGAYKNASSKEEKLSLLHDKLTKTVVYLMNLHSRFLFETRFYEERAKGFVLPSRLTEIMLSVQKEVYHDSFEEYNALFWATKLHFYLTGIPFYNFPYTFGYLFSLGIYKQLMKDPATFEEKYIALLQDTGRMKTEELAKKHLGADLTNTAFWQAAIDAAAEPIAEFQALAGS